MEKYGLCKPSNIMCYEGILTQPTWTTLKAFNSFVYAIVSFPILVSRRYLKLLKPQ